MCVSERGREVASSRPGLEARVRQLETELGRREREAREEITAAHERYRTIEVHISLHHILQCTVNTHRSNQNMVYTRLRL